MLKLQTIKVAKIRRPLYNDGMNTPARLTDPKLVLPYIFGGKAVFTLRSTESGASFTYRVEEADKRNPNDSKEIPVYFVKLLTGQDNQCDYTYVGAIFARSTFRLTSKSKLKPDAQSVKAFEWTFRQLLDGELPDFVEFLPSKRCARCGRELTSTKTGSVYTGFGPECSEIVGVAHYTPPPPTKPKSKKFVLLAEKRFDRIERFLEQVDELPEGAVQARAQEEGISIEDLDWFARRVEAEQAGKLKPTIPHYDGSVLRRQAEPTHTVPVADVEQAVAKFKEDCPEDYFQDGMLEEPEAHAVAFKKFQHELSKGRS